MASFDYSALAGDVEQIISDFGLVAVLTKVSAGGTVWAPTATTATYAVKLVDDLERTRDASGTLTGQTLRTVYVSTSAGVAPKKKDLLTFGGRTHEIGEVRPIAPGGVTVLYAADLAD